MTFSITRSMLAFILFIVASLNAAAQDSRRVYFNEGWKFKKGDLQNAQKEDFNDSEWRNVSLPHDWSVEGPFSNEWASGTGYLPAGIGWYRKSFSIPDTLKRKRLYLYFDGVYKNSEVWFNGNFLGKRPNGYTSFYYDITPYLKPDKSNLIAVKVDHSDFADSRWYTGSGINRNVYIIPVADVHIDVWGVQFTTPQITEASAVASIAVSIRNASKSDQSVKVSCEVISPKGEIVSEGGSAVNLRRARVGMARLSLRIANLQRWSPDSPTVYTLRTSVRDSRNGKVIDVVDEQVGFRDFSFDANNGFLLNGKPLKLKGVCFHDDAGALGSAVPRAVWEERLKTLKELGCNAIRMSHNPHQDYLYDLCDRMGFVVQDEAFDEWEEGKNKWINGWNVGKPGKDGYNKDFAQWAEADLRDMILRNRNRVSVLMWSIGNEIDYPNDPYTHEVLNTGRNPQIYGKGYVPANPPAKRLGEIAKRLVAVVKQYDTTRAVTAALAGVVMSNTTSYPAELDVVGYNYQEYRYDDDHQKFPARVIYGSENSKSMEAWRPVRDKEFISAQFLWTAFDFLGEARAWPVRSSGAGLIDMAGFPKPEFYHRKSLWVNEPVVALSVSKRSGDGRSTQAHAPWQQHWNWSAGDSLTVRCYSNVDKVELTLNGKPIAQLPDDDPDDNTFNYKILYEPGELHARALPPGKPVVTYKLTTAGEPSALSATSNRKTITVSPDDAAEISIIALDDAGRHIAKADDTVSVSMDGPGKLIGLESGSLTSHEDYKSNFRQLVSGRLKAYVQATGRGRIRITVTSRNLESHELSILAE